MIGWVPRCRPPGDPCDTRLPRPSTGWSPSLAGLRHFEELRERKRGNFGRGSRAFLHFHEDPAGLFVDVREGADFARHPVTTRAEQRTFLRHVRTLLRG